MGWSSLDFRRQVARWISGSQQTFSSQLASLRLGTLFPINADDAVDNMQPNVQLLTASHPIDPVARREKWETCKPVRIGDNVWIGGGAIILAGITIGDNSIIGAGAVVTCDIPANVLAVGKSRPCHARNLSRSLPLITAR
jgi:hypothetical protein